LLTQVLHLFLSHKQLSKVPEHPLVHKKLQETHFLLTKYFPFQQDLHSVGLKILTHFLHFFLSQTKPSKDGILKETT